MSWREHIDYAMGLLSELARLEADGSPRSGMRSMVITHLRLAAIKRRKEH